MKILTVNTVRSFLIMLKKHATDALKIVSKGHIKKHQKQVMI